MQYDGLIGKQVPLKEFYNPIQAKLKIKEEVDEAEGSEKRFYLEGIMLQGDKINQNKRRYPVSEIRKAVDFMNNEIKQGNDILGEVDHPDQLNINLDRVSHVITKIWMDGSDAIGRLKILRTPAGAIIESLLKEGIKLGESSRGTGNVDNNGNVSDFEIVTIDIVARPSAPDAYPKSVYEALNSKRGAIIEDLSKTVSNIKDDPKAQEHLARELINWINSLKA
jgi:hypothetical protein